MKLRLSTPFVISSVAGIAALTGDLLWLFTDTVAHPILGWERWPFFLTIGGIFMTGIILVLLGIYWYKRNGLGVHEQKVEDGFKASRDPSNV
jgi:hypothetical protein